MSEQKDAHKKGNWTIRSVYIVIGVCLIAVAVAAWITFQSISSTLTGEMTDPTDTDLIEPVDDTLSGITEEQMSKTEQVTEDVDITPETFVLPLQNGVVKKFSGEEFVYSETLRDWRTHNGADYLAEPAEEVCAIADGTVTKVYDDGLMGYVVVIESGTIETSYCGLDSEISVTEGDSVLAGQRIGTVGVIPAEQAEEPHLHLEVKRDGVYIDAEALINGTS